MPTKPARRKNSVTIQYAVPRRGVPGATAFRRWARAVSPSPVTLRIVGEREGRALNRTFRRIDHATNVLSFHTGDVVLCHPVIRREARAQGKSVAAHYAHLVVHGVLHAQGHDHEEDHEAQRMESIEAAILRRFGIGDPYA